MGCHPSKFDKKPKRVGTKFISENGKTSQRGNRTSSRPIDLIAEENLSTKNIPTHSNDEEAGESTEKQTFFGTDVSVEWLLKRLCEHSKCEMVQQTPQWILERLNKYTEKDLDHTRILRVTFGWDYDYLPKSVVLKISSKPEDIAEQTPDSKLALRMFKKECNIYEWLQKQKKASVPKIFMMQKVPTEECKESVIVMEDISERALTVDWEDEISVEAVRDLLRLLAQIHAASRLQLSEWSEIIHANTTHFYRELAAFIENVAADWAQIGEERFKKLLELTSSKYLANTVNSACKSLKCKKPNFKQKNILFLLEIRHPIICQPCLVHGNPISRNFFLANSKEIAAIIDWTQVHPGCFGEDVAKAICWNLSPRDRQTNFKKLLEFYHFSLLKYSEGTAKEITVETVENAYNHFFPMASVTYLMFLPEEQQRADPRMLERAQALIHESLNMFAGLPAAEIDKLPNEEEFEDGVNNGNVTFTI